MAAFILPSMPNLHTPRLTLRSLSLADEPAIFALRSSPAVNVYIQRPLQIHLSQARTFIEEINEGIAKKNWMYWAIVYLNSPQLTGTICLWNVNQESREAEVGYELLPQFQQCGIMGEALACVVQYAFEVLELSAVHANTHCFNERSVRLLGKLGFCLNPNIIDKDNEQLVFYTLQNPCITATYAACLPL